MTVTNINTLSTLKIDIFNHPLIKYNIFEVTVNFLPRGTPIVTISQYCEHQNISYISQSTKKSPWKHAFTAQNRTNVCTLIIGRK